jgi:hypothetical protein
MNTLSRTYNCKDEELPVICTYASTSLKRDLVYFTAYSPKINAAYVDRFDRKIADVDALVNPLTEIAERKVVTARLYATMDGLIDPLNRLEGYLKLAKETVPISITDFGIKTLRTKINSKDAEGALQYLRLVEANIGKYRIQLMEQGLNDALIGQFTAASASIAADNELQYVLLSQRKELVQNNLAQFNDLYSQLSEFCDIGKILYKQTDREKTQEYTISYLIKKVRNVSKQKPAPLDKEAGTPQ